MTSAHTSTTDQSVNRTRGRCCGGRSRRSNWSGINLFAMVVGFILFWPIGLFVLYWILTGRDVRDVPGWISQQWSKVTGMRNGFDGFGSDGYGDNEVFNEFQQTQHDRIREIREEIKERARRFTEFRAAAKRRADEEEFNHFMSDAPGQTEG
ncbi:MAG: DUF2852 domain-containing protein [Gammaproteobacteria bacterium]|nr:DUF2852 domain-containing protein [Gammaproteobacteria bacterium]